MRHRLKFIFTLQILLLLILIGPGGAEAQNGLASVLKQIVHQVESRPELRVAGERIYMAADLIDFYRQRSYQPLWRASDQDGRRQIRTMLKALASTSGTGLCGADYHLEFFQKLFSHFTIEENDYSVPHLRWSAWYDLLLTDALFHYARHMIAGRVPADAIQEGWNLRKPQVDLGQVVRYAFDHDELAKVLDDFQPDHPDYLALLGALEHYREIEAFGGWPLIPPGESLRPGDTGERIPLLRTRLLFSGDLEEVPEESDSVMSQSDAEALKHFQVRHGLSPDGVLGERTLAALNVPVSDRVKQIELNLERWRWLPKELGRKYLLVNIADFSIALVEDGATVLEMPVVVGKAYRKTPVFSARMTYLEFAPYWYVPKTILDEDKLPLIRQDPGYIEENNYELVAWDRETLLDPYEYDWDEMADEDFPGLLRQKPGGWNALGRIKFMLPNSYEVYLHDTNERHLFSQRNRQFSSGCIRLERPQELASYLLREKGWDDEDVADAFTWEEPEQVYLGKPLPVHVLYWTAWVDDAGLVHFREDVYERDRDLLQALFKVPSSCRVHRGDGQVKKEEPEEPALQ